jgi:HD-GYP domain-containing protein (c-di-GMP phosphodiesterase class II)
MREGRGTHFDPAVLDSFLEIAPDLHAHLDGRTPDELRDELQEIIQKYFTAGLRVLLA